MVRRFGDGGDTMEQANSDLTWQGVHFPQTKGKIGDVLRQLTSGGPPVGVSFQQRRTYEPEPDAEIAPGKRARYFEASDISFRSRHGTDSSLAHPSSGLPSLPSSLPEGRPMHMLARTITLSTSPFHPLEEPSPLGLKLKKTPSFLDLVAMTVGQGNSSDLMLTDGSPATSRPSGLPSTPCGNQGKLKASNFPASSLQIGTWERVSKYEGDVVAKCYYAKRKLVWEVLENGLKSKIELQWSDISAIRANYGDGQIGILEVEVLRPPLFFKETNPTPRKHTLWEATSDFTGGEATICKKHVLQFPEGVLNRHYEKLLQCDARLNSLAGNVDKYETSFETRAAPPPPPLHRQHHQAKVKMEVPYSPLENRCSPSSVMESRGSEESDGEDSQDTRLCTSSDVKSSSQQAATVVPPDGTTDFEDHKQPRNYYFVAQGDCRSTKDALNNLKQMLLEETSATPEGGSGSGLIRVSSRTELFNSEDGGLTFTPACYSVSDWSLGGHHGSEDYCPEITTTTTTFKPDSTTTTTTFRSSSTDDFLKAIGEDQDDAAIFDDDYLEDEKPAFAFHHQHHHGSSGDLLFSMPRVASLPQLFENGLVRRNSHVSLVEHS